MLCPGEGPGMGGEAPGVIAAPAEPGPSLEGDLSDLVILPAAVLVLTPPRLMAEDPWVDAEPVSSLSMSCSVFDLVGLASLAVLACCCRLSAECIESDILPSQLVEEEAEGFAPGA